MIGTTLPLAGISLVVAVCCGTVAHEWAHAFTLHLAAIDYTIDYVPRLDSSPKTSFLTGSLATVTPTITGQESPWILRLSALSPVLLAAPIFAFGALGVLSLDHPVLAGATLGWLACAIPSPSDFSIAFYAHDVVDAPLTSE